MTSSLSASQSAKPPAPPPPPVPKELVGIRPPPPPASLPRDLPPLLPCELDSAPRIGKIQIYTCGRLFIHEAFGDTSVEQKAADNKELKDVFQQNGISLSCIASAWEFRIPEPGELRNHIGFHPYIMLGVLNDERWPYFYSHIEKALREHVQKHPQQTFHLLCVCNRGIHRSVAAASLFGAVALDRGYHVLPTRHMHSYAWKFSACQRRNKDGLRECLHCDSPTPAIKEIRAIAVERCKELLREF